MVGSETPLEARRGRQRQRYGEAGERLVAGCIPMRYHGSGRGIDQVEVLLVTRRCGRGWIFPKGGWENDEQTPEHAALRETIEEAGVKGKIEEPILGTFPFVSQKRGGQEPINVPCLAYMYVMRVEEQLDEWPEQLERKRDWFSLPEVCDRCSQDWMRKALAVWIQRRGWDAIGLQIQAPPVPDSEQSNGLAPV